MEKYQQKIDQIDCQMQNVKSPSFQNIYLPRGDSKTPKPVICNVSHLAELITRKDEVLKDMGVFNLRVDRVNKKLERLTPRESDILIKVYVEKISLEEVINGIYGDKDKPTINAFRLRLDHLIWKCVK